MEREYQIKQLPIALVPMAFTAAAIAVLRWLPDELMLTAAYPAVGWSVVGGMGCSAIAWAVFQLRVSRHRRQNKEGEVVESPIESDPEQQ